MWPHNPKVRRRTFSESSEVHFEEIRLLVRRRLRLSARLVSYDMIQELWLQASGDELHATGVNLRRLCETIEELAKGHGGDVHALRHAPKDHTGHVDDAQVQNLSAVFKRMYPRLSYAPAPAYLSYRQPFSADS